MAAPRLAGSGHFAGSDLQRRSIETGYAQLLDAVHQQLGGPSFVVWDNSTPTSAAPWAS